MRPNARPRRGSQRHLRGPAVAVFRALLPHAERDEVLADLAAEWALRVNTGGRLGARLWLWRQLIGSLPALLYRCWWRGMTGFEPRANRLRTGGSVLEGWIIDTRYYSSGDTSDPAFKLDMCLATLRAARAFAVLKGEKRKRNAHGYAHFFLFTLSAQVCHGSNYTRRGGRLSLSLGGL